MTAHPAVDPVALTRRLVRIPSSDPPGGELAVAEAVHAVLGELGIESELDEFLPGRANVVGRLRGSGERPALVCSAHLDTTPPGDQPWTFDPFAGDVVDGRVRGRGASDMKSAVAAFVAAACLVRERGVPLRGDLVLAFTAGESANCLGARRLVERGFQREIGAFLCGEPSTLDVIVAEKAILWLRAEARGAIGHVSGDPGVSAIDLMLDYLVRLRDLRLDLPEHPLLTPPSVGVGRIEGGTAVNLTPDRCVAEIDVRFGPGVAPEEAIAQLARLAPDGVTLETIDFKPAVAAEPASPFVRLCAEAVRAETGREPAVLGVSYYSDGAILLDGLDVPFAILGPGDLGQSGQPDETASAERIREVVPVYARIVEGWLGAG